MGGMMDRKWLLSLGMLVLASQALMAAGSRDEGDMFGDAAPSATESSAKAKQPTADIQAQPADRDEANMTGATSGTDAFASGATKEDPLDIGGIFYQHADVSFVRGLTEGEQPLSLPLQLDAYLDARPNDRLRGYLGARLLYDSTRDVYGNSTAGPTGLGALPSASTFTAAPLPNNPQVVLDQAWLKFDVERTAFISIGKQHVKWGTGRIWNPSDALNPQRRDPLQPYDLRLGSNMATLQLPWERQQANLYAIVLLDNPQPASTLQQVGGAVRVEGILGPAEVGASVVGRPGMNPRYGADISTPLGPFDAYAETAIFSGDGNTFTTFNGLPSSLSPTPSIFSLYTDNRLPGAALQAVGGINYTFAWRENRLATIGGEYFYNEMGTTQAGLYPILLYQGRYQPFYVGKHYAAVYLSLEGPDQGKKTSYNFSTISNLSDQSYVSRLDFRWLLLEYLSFGAYASANYGNLGGEFNFVLDTPALTAGAGAIPAVRYEGSSGSAGMSLRMSF
jgi:hypothetical protein